MKQKLSPDVGPVLVNKQVGGQSTQKALVVRSSFGENERARQAPIFATSGYKSFCSNQSFGEQISNVPRKKEKQTPGTRGELSRVLLLGAACILSS